MDKQHTENSRYEYIMCRKNVPPDNKQERKGEWVEGRLLWCDKRAYPEVKLLVFSNEKQLWTFGYRFDVDTKQTNIRWAGNLPSRYGLLYSHRIIF